MKYLFVPFLSFLLFSCNSKNVKKAASNKQETAIIPKHLTFNKSIVGFFKEARSTEDKEIRKLLDLTSKENSVIGSPENEFVIYLGELIWENQKIQIFKQFYTVQAAIQKHGHTEIILINDRTANYYDLETPENLPLSLKENQFQFISNKDTVNMELCVINRNEVVFSTKCGNELLNR